MKMQPCIPLVNLYSDTCMKERQSRWDEQREQKENLGEVTQKKGNRGVR